MIFCSFSVEDIGQPSLSVQSQLNVIHYDGPKILHLTVMFALCVCNSIYRGFRDTFIFFHICVTNILHMLAYLSTEQFFFLRCFWLWSQDLTYFLLLFKLCGYRIKASCFPIGRLFVIHCRLRRMFFGWYYLLPLGDNSCICIYMLPHLTSKWTSVINPRIKHMGELETCQEGTRCTNNNRGELDNK